jgi:protein-tyrosine phosphatase
VTGDFGRRAWEAATELIDSGLVHFVASDAHGRLQRPPGLSRARSEISRRWGERSARHLTEDNPRAVLEHREIAVPSATLT